MEYRKMEKLNISPSLLGFGGMRYPTKDGKIDRIESAKMMDHALDSGITYIDTAYPYHSGESELFLGEYLKTKERNSFYLATKLPLWAIKTYEDAVRIFEEQLERLQTDYFDFYLMHAYNQERFDAMNELGVLALMEKYQKEGKIKHLGFSFHDSYEVFEKIITFKKWDFCQIQLNYMDTDEQAGMKGYELAEKLGVPLVIMEPVKGGSLATFADDITGLFTAFDEKRSVASWAFRWVGSLPNVKVILSGMSNMEQLEDNLATFDKFKPLSEEEQKLISEVVEEVKARTKNGCTNCKYCMPCPFGVNIPGCFSIWNNYSMYGNKDSANWRYYLDMKAEARADQCMDCGACEEVCPQHIPIREHLRLVTKDMETVKK